MVLSMERWVGKVAVVTGASAGIGAAITESLAKEGVKVAALARRKDRLEDLVKKLSNAKGKVYPIVADIAKEEDILKAFKYIKENLGPVHILINNAGVGHPAASIPDGLTESWKDLLNINVIGLCVATREAIRDMKANNVDGHIIHINSIAGHRVLSANTTIYPASKFAVTALAETLRLELMNQKSKIKISNISPGLVLTEFKSPIRETEAYKKAIVEKQIIDAEDVAESVIYALSTPPHVQIQELTIRPVSEITK